MKKSILLALLVVGCEKNTKWEYCHVVSLYMPPSFQGAEPWWIHTLSKECYGTAESKGERGDISPVLNKLGEKGWELFKSEANPDPKYVKDSHTYYFKRKR